MTSKIPGLNSVNTVETLVNHQFRCHGVQVVTCGTCTGNMSLMQSSEYVGGDDCNEMADDIAGALHGR